MNYIRFWDEQAAARVDGFIANSSFVAKRIKKYYQRESEIIHPPIRTDLFYLAEKPEKYFLMVGRLLTYKRFDLAIEAFNQLGWPLKIVGDGPDRSRLEKMARGNIEFVGLVPDSKLRDYYAHCRAFVFPQEEDFGIVPVEAMASGRPVIAYQGGGALEIVQPGVTGMFFKEQTTECLIDALKQFEPDDFNPKIIKEQAEKFSQERFKEKIKEYLNEYRN